MRDFWEFVVFALERRKTWKTFPTHIFFSFKVIIILIIIWPPVIIQKRSVHHANELSETRKMKKKWVKFKGESFPRQITTLCGGPGPQDLNKVVSAICAVSGDSMQVDRLTRAIMMRSETSQVALGKKNQSRSQRWRTFVRGAEERGNKESYTTVTCHHWRPTQWRQGEIFCN